MTSSARTKTARAAAGAEVCGDAPFHGSDVWVAWMPAEAAPPVEANAEIEGLLPILSGSDEGRPLWFNRVLGILVVLCLVLAVAVWWRLLS